MTPEERAQWQAYLDAFKRKAHRKALQEAILDDETTEQPKGYKDGSGDIQIVFKVPPNITPWAIPDSGESGAVE